MTLFMARQAARRRRRAWLPSLLPLLLFLYRQTSVFAASEGPKVTCPAVRTKTSAFLVTGADEPTANGLYFTLPPELQPPSADGNTTDAGTSGHGRTSLRVVSGGSLRYELTRASESLWVVVRATSVDQGVTWRGSVVYGSEEEEGEEAPSPKGQRGGPPAAGWSRFTSSKGGEPVSIQGSSGLSVQRVAGAVPPAVSSVSSGLVLAMQGRWAEARACLLEGGVRAASSLPREWQLAYYDAGAALAQAVEWHDGAEGLLLSALQVVTDSALGQGGGPRASRFDRWEQAWFRARLGYARLCQGRLAEGQADLRLALASVPASPERSQWLTDLGHVSALLGRLDDARDAYRLGQREKRQGSAREWPIEDAPSAFRQQLGPFTCGLESVQADLLGSSGQASAPSLADLAEDAQRLGLGQAALGLWRQLLTRVPEQLQPVVLLRVALQELLVLPGSDLADRSRSLRRFSRPSEPFAVDDKQHRELYWRLLPSLPDWLPHPPQRSQTLAHLQDMYSFIAHNNNATWEQLLGGGREEEEGEEGLRLTVVSEAEVDCLVLEGLMQRGLSVSVLVDGPRASECEFWDESVLPLFSTATLPQPPLNATAVDDAAALVAAQRPDVVLFTAYRRPLLHHLAMRRLAPIQVQAPGLPEGPDGYGASLQQSKLPSGPPPPSIDLLLTTDQTLPADHHGDDWQPLVQEVRLLPSEPLPSYVGHFRDGLCAQLLNSSSSRDAGVRARFLAGLPPRQASLYLVLAYHPQQLADPDFQHALALILRQDRQGAVVVVDDGPGCPPLAWAGFRSAMTTALGDDRSRLFLLTQQAGGGEQEKATRRAELMSAADVLLDPFPTGGHVDTYALALQACGERGLVLPVATAPVLQQQVRSQPAMAAYRALLGEEALAELDPAAMDVEDYARKAVAFAHAKAPLRRKLQNLMKKKARRAAFDQVVFEEEFVDQLSTELSMVIKTARRGVRRQLPSLLLGSMVDA